MSERSDGVAEAAALAAEYVESMRQRSTARVDPKRHQHEAPPGYRLRGVSTLLDADGAVKQTWVKTALDHDDPAATIAAFKGMVEASDIRAKEPIPPPVIELSSDLLSMYKIGDPHIGALAWKLECGEDFDLKIAEDTLFAAADKLVGLTPYTEEAVIVEVGDLFHSDGHKNQTTSGTPVDVDSRLGKVFRVGMSTMTRITERALEKHEIVHFKSVVGNHDGTLSVLFPLMMKFYYRDNPRVIVDDSPSPYQWFRWHNNLFGIVHGDMQKMSDLGEIMATDRPKDWGETEHRYWVCGHLHHSIRKELRGCTVDVLPTMAAKDAWHNRSGYRSARAMKASVYHREFGLRCDYQVGISEIR